MWFSHFHNLLRKYEAPRISPKNYNLLLLFKTFTNLDRININFKNVKVIIKSLLAW